MEITRDYRAFSGPAAENDPAERILSTARKLFYAGGFPTTGVNRIIAESGTSKKSFYRYFPAKDDLGAAYLEREKRDFLDLFRKLGAKTATNGDFVRAWCFILKKEVARGRYHGCPFGNFASQTAPREDERFGSILREVIADWREILSAQLRDGSPAVPEADIPRTVDRMLMLYEGAVVLWKITGETTYLERLEEELLATVTGC